MYLIMRLVDRGAIYQLQLPTLELKEQEIMNMGIVRSSRERGNTLRIKSQITPSLYGRAYCDRRPISKTLTKRRFHDFRPPTNCQPLQELRNV